MIENAYQAPQTSEVKRGFSNSCPAIVQGFQVILDSNANSPSFGLSFFGA
jgi:hypothetical protein